MFAWLEWDVSVPLLAERWRKALPQYVIGLAFERPHSNKESVTFFERVFCGEDRVLSPIQLVRKRLEWSGCCRHNAIFARKHRVGATPLLPQVGRLNAFIPGGGVPKVRRLSTVIIRMNTFRSQQANRSVCPKLRRIDCIFTPDFNWLYKIQIRQRWTIAGWLDNW